MSLEGRLFALLEHERQDVRCAAAMVLGAAGQGHAGAAKALLAHAGDRDPVVKRQVLDALTQLAPLPAAAAKTLIAKLTPLCASADAEVATRALALLVAQGGRAAEVVLETQLAEPHAPAGARTAAAALLVKAGTAPADAALLAALGEGDVGEHVLQLLRAEIDGDAKRRAAIGERAEKALGALAKDAPATRRGALLRLLGYLGREETLPLLLRAAGKGSAPELRAAAIAAMRRALAQKRSHPKVVAALLDFAADPDPRVAGAAVDTLGVAAIPETMAARLAALIDAKNPDARRLAAAKLGQGGARDALPALVRTLVELPAADEAGARRVSGTVRPHEGKLDEKSLDLLARRAEVALAAPEDRAGLVVLELVARLAPARYLGLVIGRARKQRKQGDFGGAWLSVRPALDRGGAALAPADRFFAAVCGLVAEGKGLLRAARTVDPVLIAFRDLAAEGFPVARTLAKEKDVPDDAAFVLGFNLVESTDENDRGLGEELLEAIISAGPRSKLAIAAKNKLSLSRRD